MININELVAGRRASFVHVGEVETVGKRQFTSEERAVASLNALLLGLPVENDWHYAPEWMQNASITRRAVFSGNVADEESYGKLMQRGIDADNEDRKANGLKALPKYKSTGKAWFHHHEEQAGIVLHNASGKPYLCALHPKVTKVEYFVNGNPATAAQLEAIQAFKKKSSKNGKFAVYALDKVVCEGYVENEDLAEVED